MLSSRYTLPFKDIPSYYPDAIYFHLFIIIFSLSLKSHIANQQPSVTIWGSNLVEALRFRRNQIFNVAL